MLMIQRPNPTSEEIRRETRNLRYLQFLVGVALQEIRSGRLSREQAETMAANVRAQALKLFPGKETAFEWIYQPRFRRAITETFQLH